uniref:Uncharacterized protein n=1 Tax=Aplanochytrium stocchinoi TaxID=215587 RepID=A0A7S3PP72_9STRA|mmetsp:Transcript_28614/g.35108  ORF Transcript_28614/g.35108 Transcript_28614/m.35108 type:complete len:275 (-) Transcript_28614:705-1529(-)
MDDMFDGGDSDSEFGFDMGNVRADSAEVDDFTEVDSDDAEAQGTNINRKLDEFAVYNTRKQKNDQNDYERDVDESHDDDDDDDDDDYENNNKGNLDIDMNSTTDTLVVKRGFLREFDTDEYSVPEELEHLRGTEILRDLKQSPISWSRKKQRVQEARAIAKATVFTSKEKIWRIVIPLVVAILLHGINLLSRKRLKLLVGLFAMMVLKIIYDVIVSFIIEIYGKIVFITSCFSYCVTVILITYYCYHVGIRCSESASDKGARTDRNLQGCFKRR